MQSRRVFAVALLALLPSPGRAQPAASPFVGTWTGDVPGISAATLVISGVGPDGKVAGRMEFALQSFVSTFGDTANSATRTNYGIVSGSTLTIESALGGQYVLRRDGDQLSGQYTRGTTYDVAVSFRKS